MRILKVIYALILAFIAGVIYMIYPSYFERGAK